VRKFLIFLLGLVSLGGVSYALTPRSAGDSESFRVFDPRSPSRQLSDARHEWRLQPGGAEVRRFDRTNGALVGRYAVQPRAKATLAVEWRTQHANGLVLAPRLFGRQLYSFSYITGTNGMAMTLYLTPIMERRPAL
jgi:hypothetical protein